MYIMKAIATLLNEHLQQECLTLATCWKLVRRDGVLMGFTDHDQDLLIDGINYKAATGFTSSSIDSQASLAVDNLDVEGMLQSGSINEQDIMAGHYDFAEIEIFMVNYIDLTAGVINLRKGWLGEVQIENGQFIAEIRGLTQQLSQNIGELYSPICRAKFGDARCGFDIGSVTVTGTVTAVTDNRVFSDSTRVEEDGYYNWGQITFTSGENAGISREVKEFGKTIITMALPMPFLPSIGDSYILTQGCDKSFHSCVNRYNNALNFRGEPNLPGLDKMLETAGTRTT